MAGAAKVQGAEWVIRHGAIGETGIQSEYRR